MARSRLQLMVGLAAAVCALALAVVLPDHDSLDVSVRARRTAPFPHVPRARFTTEPPYVWLPGCRLLEIRDDATIHRVDASTGADVTVLSLAQVYRRDKTLSRLAPTGPKDLVISPDGRWVLTCTTDMLRGPAVSGQSMWLAATIDGRHVVQRPAAGGWDWTLFWDSTDDAWMDLPTQITRPGHIAYVNTQVTRSGSLPAIPGAQYTLPLGYPAGGRRSTFEWAVVAPLQVGIVTAPSQSPAVTTTRALRPPGNNLFVSDIRISPDGQRLAWAVHDFRGMNVPAWFHTIAPSLWGDNEQIWVSGVDGSRMHEVLTATDGAGGTPGYLAWTPDGKRLSFVYKDAIWTTPAP